MIRFGRLHGLTVTAFSFVFERAWDLANFLLGSGLCLGSCFLSDFTELLRLLHVPSLNTFAIHTKSLLQCSVICLHSICDGEVVIQEMYINHNIIKLHDRSRSTSKNVHNASSLSKCL